MWRTFSTKEGSGEGWEPRVECHGHGAQDDVRPPDEAMRQRPRIGEGGELGAFGVTELQGELPRATTRHGGSEQGPPIIMHRTFGTSTLGLEALQPGLELV